MNLWPFRENPACPDPVRKPANLQQVGGQRNNGVIL